VFALYARPSLHEGIFLPSPILARADALMQRQLHAQSSPDEVPTLTEAIGDDGIPLLLNAEPPIKEMPSARSNASTEASSTESPTIRLDFGLSEILVRELARRVKQRLATELPIIIESTVRDFLAEQELNENT
jgi:hypothetical protein